MTRFFWLREEAPYPASIDAAHKWSLPGVKCSGCGVTWGAAGHQYPGVDLSQLSERAKFVRPWPVPEAELARLRDLVRPLAPPNAKLPPGTRFGPLEGRASGKFGPFTSEGDILWVGNFATVIVGTERSQVPVAPLVGGGPGQACTPRG
ncbi:double-CXXCG motif protein [Pyxidicoccus sp. QH1ED-7-1]|nr:double-CXXCG motif protein [Pyxidicoccus xibeiensis]